MKFLVLALSAILVMTGCDERKTVTKIPKPIALPEDAVGYYCHMIVLGHSGPKAQIHLQNTEKPIWFTQVRDAIAYTRLPEETKKARVIYVHDMSQATSWDDPGDHAWINIDDAYFVIGSEMTGGMGAPEAVPFGSQQAAQNFAASKGGKVVQLSAIPDTYVLAPVEMSH